MIGAWAERGEDQGRSSSNRNGGKQIRKQMQCAPGVRRDFRNTERLLVCEAGRGVDYILI